MHNHCLIKTPREELRMKKITDRIEIETLLGGSFGAIAIIAIIVEMALAGFDAAANAGGLKDIAGTVVTVMVFIFAAKALFQKEDTSFNAVFEKEMKIEVSMVLADFIEALFVYDFYLCFRTEVFLIYKILCIL